MTPERGDTPVHVKRFKSYRDELAALLTQFHYRADGVTLTAAEPRPLPSTACDAPTAGLEAVFAADSSLVFVCYDERGHRMVNPIETRLLQAIGDAVKTAATTVRPDGGATGPLGEGPTATDNDQRSLDPGQSEDGAHDVSPAPSLGVVTPHNAQRGALETVLPDNVITNTVEKYQGGERDIIAVLRQCRTRSLPARKSGSS